jgi:hypothetical protein
LAYQQMAVGLALTAVRQIVEGCSFPAGEMSAATPIGRVTFSLSQRNRTVHIEVREFTVPHSPSPNGGKRRKTISADGLVLGLRGSKRSFHLVTFYGKVPPIPARNAAGSGVARKPASRHSVLQTGSWLLDNLICEALLRNLRNSRTSQKL